MATHALVGVAPCGCIRVAVVDEELSKESRKELAACVRDGYTVERRLLDDVRKPGAWDCGTETCPFRKRQTIIEGEE